MVPHITLPIDIQNDDDDDDDDDDCSDAETKVSENSAKQ